MNPYTIIQRKMNNEGFPIPRDRLAKMASGRIRLGLDWTFQYDRVLFTVSKGKGEVHLYSLDAGTALLGAVARFMSQVWEIVPHPYLIAPILNKRVMRLAERFGWIPVGKIPSGHTMYVVRRPEK